MVTLDMIRKPVEGDLEAFEQFIRQKFTADGTLLSEMLDYALSARGKGIRPMTVLLSAALNAPAGQRSGGLRALLAATLVEMIHVASLIHDDVIDEAVVVGDYILAKNMDLGLKSGQFDLVTHVCGAIATLCEGEILQNDKANRQEMTRASYLDIIYKKTACLIGVSASAGALAVGASREKQALMRKFGESIGMAFQIQDDILDYTRTARTGKPSNNDLREHKVTLPLLTVLESVGEERRRELLARLARCHEEDESVEYLQHIVENEGGMEKAARVMQEYLTRAMSVLSEYEPSEYRDALANLCVYVGERDR